MSDCRQYRIPVFESVFFLNNLLIFRLDDICNIDTFRSAVRRNHIFTADDIAFLELFLEPLVDLILCLGTLYNIQPVTAWSLGILGCQDLDSVAILNLIINVNKFSVDSGSYHLVTDRTVDRISKIDRS